MAEILIGSDKARSKRGPCVVTVGAFDGVHVGHQDIVRTAIATARDRGVSSCVVTFDPHPAAYAGIEGFRYLTSLDDRLEYLDATGVDVIRVLPFDADLAKTPPDEYIRDVLVGGLGAVAVVRCRRTECPNVVRQNRDQDQRKDVEDDEEQDGVHPDAVLGQQRGEGVR